MRQALVALGPKSVVRECWSVVRCWRSARSFCPTRCGPSTPGDVPAGAARARGVRARSTSAPGPKATSSSRRRDAKIDHLRSSRRRARRLRVAGYRAADAPVARASTRTTTRRRSCRASRTRHPFRKTPRTGIVTVERWNGPATATAMNGDPGAGRPVEHDGDERQRLRRRQRRQTPMTSDSEEALADAQRELADAQKEIDGRDAQANQEAQGRARAQRQRRRRLARRCCRSSRAPQSSCLARSMSAASIAAPVPGGVQPMWPVHTVCTSTPMSASASAAMERRLAGGSMLNARHARSRACRRR